MQAAEERGEEDDEDALSEAENERTWAEEAERRDRDLDSDGDDGRSADEVLRDARDRLG